MQRVQGIYKVLVTSLITNNTLLKKCASMLKYTENRAIDHCSKMPEMIIHAISISLNLYILICSPLFENDISTLNLTTQL